jgi:hypothetical protein
MTGDRPSEGRRPVLAYAVVSFVLLAGLAAALWPDALALYRLFFPLNTDAAWESKVGWRLCNGAIADWPAKPAPSCARLTMCDNEGGLNAPERKRLGQMMAAAKCDD